MPPSRYVNPVFGEPFPDPFVLRRDGAYYAYCTDIGGRGPRVIGLLRSEDLTTWTPLPGPLERPPFANLEFEFWAPEVATGDDGRLYMYYSTGEDDVGHRLRVAAADDPTGPFRDLGRELVPDAFAIDAHPFRDDDGTWYLYYARDFLDGDRVGTSLVVDRLVDMVSLEGEPTTVLRATADWQIYQRGRPMYGAVYDWHTLEGPFVVKRHGRYWCLYSGGAWREQNYGVSYAVANSPTGPFVDAPGEGPAILRTVSGRVLGPGHCSVTTAPDGTDWLVYHAWDAARTARRMCIDRLVWTPDGPRCDGPSWDEQPGPVSTSGPALERDQPPLQSDVAPAPS
jgi:beta-xylosidase